MAMPAESVGGLSRVRLSSASRKLLLAQLWADLKVLFRRPHHQKVPYLVSNDGNTPTQCSAVPLSRAFLAEFSEVTNAPAVQSLLLPPVDCPPAVSSFWGRSLGDAGA